MRFSHSNVGKLSATATSRPVARGQLRISHTWLQKLVLEFQEAPDEIQREVRWFGDPTVAQLTRAQRYTQRMIAWLSPTFTVQVLLREKLSP